MQKTVEVEIDGKYFSQDQQPTILLVETPITQNTEGPEQTHHTVHTEGPEDTDRRPLVKAEFDEQPDLLKVTKKKKKRKRMGNLSSA